MSQVAIVGIVMFVITVMFFLGERFGDSIKHWSGKVIKYFFWFIAAWLCVAALSITVEIVEDNAYPFSNIINVMYGAVFYVMLFLTTSAFIGGMYYFFKWLGDRAGDLNG